MNLDKYLKQRKWHVSEVLLTQVPDQIRLLQLLSENINIKIYKRLDSMRDIFCFYF